MLLQINGVSHGFDGCPVLHDINLSVNRGQFVAFVGPSGCGKTTLLKAILGTHPTLKGSIKVDGKPVTGPSRDIGIVYQHYSLYGHMTALKNVMVGPRWDQSSIPGRMLLLPLWLRTLRGHRKDAIALLERVGLDHAVDHYPANLSGGMRQRVAIAQAILNKPKLLLLDEPFGALDTKTRESLQDLLLDLYQENVRARKRGAEPPYTVIMVTHELEEAFIIADRVIGFSKRWCNSEATGEASGATIVYDRAAPIYEPGKPRNYESFAFEQECLTKVVFEGDGTLDPGENCTFWSDLQEGVGTGISVMRQEAER